MSKILTFLRRSKSVVKRTLSSGGYEADFYTDTTVTPPIVHFIITKKGDADILAWGQERSIGDAEKAALDCMHDLYQRSLGASAAG
jgi:hypothetical protein